MHQSGEQLTILGLTVLAGLSLTLTAVAQACVGVALRRPLAPGPRPPISVLKPLKGVEDGLYANLVALVEQRYPEFELLFGAEDPADPALAVVQRLRRYYPDTPIRVVTGGPRIGHNPKVNNLAQLLPLARYEHILISDANVRPGPDYLARLADELADPRVGLVHSPLVGAGERSLGATLEHLHLAGFVIRSVCLGVVLANQPAVIGKSMLMRRADLESIGGLASVKDLLAEDYQLARRFTAAGLHIALSPQLLPTIDERWPVRRFLARHLRWSQMRRRQCPGFYLLEPLGYPGAIACALLLATRGAAWPTALLILAIQAALDAALWHRLRGGGPRLVLLLLRPVRDLLALAVWCIGLFKRGVDWRGHRFVLGPDAALQPPPTWAPAPALERQP